MAFDLNKKDDSKSSINLSKKALPETSRFDLSKQNNGATAAPHKTSKSGPMIWGLLAVVLAGGAVWYFKSGAAKDPDPAKHSLATDNANAPTSNVVSTLDTSKIPPVKTTIDSSVAKSTPSSSDAVNTGSVQTSSETSAKSNDHNSVNSGNGDNETANPKAVVSKTTLTDLASWNNKVSATFRKSSSNIQILDKHVNADLVSYLSKNPAANITVLGYASSEGALNTNQDISQERANQYKKYLLKKGISSSRITATGKGIENPIASNETESGRKQNRRVEIVLQ